MPQADRSGHLECPLPGRPIEDGMPASNPPTYVPNGTRAARCVTAPLRSNPPSSSLICRASRDPCSVSQATRANGRTPARPSLPAPSASTPRVGAAGICTALGYSSTPPGTEPAAAQGRRWASSQARDDDADWRCGKVVSSPSRQTRQHRDGAPCAEQRCSTIHRHILSPEKTCACHQPVRRHPPVLTRGPTA